jgi:hypothetical protein
MTRLLMRFSGISLIALASLTLVVILVGKALPSKGLLAYVALINQVAYLWELDPSYGISMPIVEDVSLNSPIVPSPDGQRIAFFREVDTGAQFNIVNVDGSNPLSWDSENSLNYDISSISWMPNSEEVILLSRFTPLRVINISTAQITTARSLEGLICESIVLSPDGQRIAGLGGVESPNGSINCSANGIRVMDLASRDNILQLFPDEQGLKPLWSPDSTHLVIFGLSGLFIATDEVTPTIYQLDTLVFPVTSASPVWSPDSTHLAMVLGGNPDIWVVLVEEGALSRDLTLMEGVESYPAWSPDSTEIAFISMERRDLEIYIVNVATGAIRRVTHNEVTETNLVWLP